MSRRSVLNVLFWAVSVGGLMAVLNGDQRAVTSVVARLSRHLVCGRQRASFARGSATSAGTVQPAVDLASTQAGCC